jgi:hypothetical protein
VFLRFGTLFAVRFDAAAFAARGEPVALVSGVAHALSGGNSGDVTGAGQYDVAATGHLAYLSGGVVPYPERRPVAVARDGHVTPLPGPGRSYALGVRISPDGRSMALGVQDLTGQSVWRLDLSRTVLTRVTTEGEAAWPQWTPDGRRLAFAWLHGGRYRIAWQPADGGGPAEALAEGKIVPASWRPDGKELLAVAFGETEDDIVAIPIGDGPRPVRPVVATPAEEAWPEVSPDGRWLAYAADTSGRLEVYLQPYPGPGGRVQVSVDGAWSPAWHPKGRELFFVAPAGTADRRVMMAVDVDPRSGLRLGRPRRLFEFEVRDLRFACVPMRCYDVAPDGHRFYVTQSQTPPSPPPRVTHISLVQHWVEELKAKVPAGQ